MQSFRTEETEPQSRIQWELENNWYHELFLDKRHSSTERTNQISLSADWGILIFWQIRETTCRLRSDIITANVTIDRVNALKKNGKFHSKNVV